MTDLTLTPEIREMRQRVRSFMDEHVFPNEEVLSEQNGRSESLMKELQGKTKSMGMWCSSSHWMTPTWAIPRADPPARVSPMVGRFLAAVCVWAVRRGREILSRRRRVMVRSWSVMAKIARGSGSEQHGFAGADGLFRDFGERGREGVAMDLLFGGHGVEAEEAVEFPFVERFEGGVSHFLAGEPFEFL